MSGKDKEPQEEQVVVEEEESQGQGGVSRRAFLGAAAGGVAGLVVGAAGAAALLPTKEVVKEVPKEVVKEVTKEVQVATSGMVPPAQEAETSFIKNLGYCGNPPAAGSLASSVDVKNGRVVRIRPFHFDAKYKPEEFNAWKITARGKTFDPKMKTLVSAYALASKQRVYSPNRIKYPLMRVDWQPGGDPKKVNPQNRGISKYKRITWDQAATYIADELKRIKNQYGANAGQAIYNLTAPHGQTKVLHYAHGVPVRAIVPFMGAPCGSAGEAMGSWTGWILGSQHVWGMTQHLGMTYPATNVIKDIMENGEMILHWGCDVETAPLGWGGYQAGRITYFWTQLGIKQVYVDPILNYGAAVHADKWIPVLPNTDAALHLAIAYTWMTEGTYDKDYVASHSVGFDAFQNYVLGKEDGVPKTPKWASPICGVPVWTIKALAREWAAKKTSIAHCNGGPMIRGPYSHESARAESVNLAMQGVGKPGRHEIGMIEWNHFGSPVNMNPLPHPAVLPDLGKGVRKAPVAPAKQDLPSVGFADGILKGTYTTKTCARFAMPQWETQTYPAKDMPEVHMIWSDAPCWIACKNNSNHWIEAMRSPKIEFIVTQHPWFENGCQYSDIILPISTKFEEDDIGEDVLNGQYSMIFLEGKCIPNVGESKSDYEAVGEVAKKLGVYDKFTEGKTDEQWKRAGFDGSGLVESVKWETFTANGYYVVPTKKDWDKDPVGLSKFVADPKANKLETPSGLIEFESQGIKQHFPDDRERPPVVHYVAGGPGWTHDESLSGERAKKYPLLMISNHPKWRVHSEHDDISWLREIPTCKVKGFDGYLYEPVWINPVDAKKRGIEHGDIVKIFNERGAVLGGAYVTDRIIPGAISQDHGARADPITDKLDRGGENNLITPNNRTSQNATGEVCSGFLVELEKVTPAQMDEWKKQYPAAFAREYDPASGLRFNSWVEGGMA